MILELEAVNAESQAALDEQAAYHLARANIVEKVLTEPNIKDLKSKLLKLFLMGENSSASNFNAN